MLKQIRIKNFQNHKNTILNLSPNVNVIAGASDNGKTGILRSENLVINNRPSGYSYKPWNAKKKDITEIVNVFDNGTVKRTKSNTIDSYQINDNEPFESLNRQVPEEVKKLINLGDYQFQEQHDGHFFIAKNISGGERAKLLNEVSGLEIIDKSLSNINSIIRENNSNLEKSKKEIKETQEKIDKISFAKEADEVLVQIEEMFTKTEQLEMMNKNLTEYSQQLELIENEISQLNKFLEIKNHYLSLIELIEQYQKINKENENLIKYVNELNEVEETIESNKEFLKAKEYYDSLITLIGSYNELYKKVQNLVRYTKEREENNDVIESCTEWLKCKNLYTSISHKIDSYKAIQANNATLHEWVEESNTGHSVTIQAISKIEGLKKKKEDFILAFDICPFCGTEVKNAKN